MNEPKILETVPVDPAPAPAAERSQRFPCRQCGAEQAEEVSAEVVRCLQCGHEQPLTLAAGAPIEEHDLQRELARQAERRRGTAPPGPGQLELQCGSCGATVLFVGAPPGSSCGLCGTPVRPQDARQAADRIPVDAVLPFAIDEAAARQAVASWVKGRWFAPGEWKRRGVAGDVQGVYLPFFTFDAMTSAEYRGERGDDYDDEGHRYDPRQVHSRNERHRTWTRASGSLKHFCDDVTVPAFRSLPQKLLDRLEPWPLAKCVPFSPEALAGKLAYGYDQGLGPCFDVARKKMEQAVEVQAMIRMGGDSQKIRHLRVDYAALTFKHVLLPVWLMAYRHGKKTYRVTINACNGAVMGERPYSALKIGLTVAAALAVLVILL